MQVIHMRMKSPKGTRYKVVRTQRSMKLPGSIAARLLIVPLVFLIYALDRSLTLATKELLPYLRYRNHLECFLKS